METDQAATKKQAPLPKSAPEAQVAPKAQAAQGSPESLSPKSGPESEMSPDTSSLIPRAVFSSPHVFQKRSSAQIMWIVNICLLPAALWGIWLFGWPALRVLLLSLLSTVGVELIMNLLSRSSSQNAQKSGHISIDDGSAVVSGLLLGMNLSPLAPWYIPIFGGIFAMLVCKWSFGGLGANWVNPALAGRAFVFFSFGQEMSRWPVPRYIFSGSGLSSFDAESVATPLTVFKEGLLANPNVTEAANQVGSAAEAWGQNMQGTGHALQEPLLQLLFGFRGGSLGEVSTILLLLGGLALLALRIISWHIPIAYLGSFALLTWAFGGEVLFHLFSGGLMLGAWFMATDYSSSPKMPLAKLIFGFGCGLLTFLVRFYGSYPEGVMLAILFMNIWTPTLDIVIHPKTFGTGANSGTQKNGLRRSTLKLPEY